MKAPRGLFCFKRVHFCQSIFLVIEIKFESKLLIINTQAHNREVSHPLG